MHIKKLTNLNDGKLYELKFDAVEGVSADRLDLGYFYVQKDKIYKIDPTEDNLKILQAGKMPEDSVVVCQEEEIKDALGENEAGWHHFLDVNGDKREYHSFNNKIETGYYESFTWGKNRGLIHYRSGYGAENDSIELKR